MTLKLARAEPVDFRVQLTGKVCPVGFSPPAGSLAAVAPNEAFVTSLAALAGALVESPEHQLSGAPPLLTKAAGSESMSGSGDPNPESVASPEL